MLIQCPTEGFMPFRLGIAGAHLSEVVMPDGTPMGTASITARVCLPEHASEGHRTLVPRDDGSLSAIKFPLSSKELVLQLGGCYRGGNRQGNRGPTPVNKQRPMTR
jgi:hypothetical protein